MIYLKFLENISFEKYIEFENKHQKSHFLQSYAWGKFCKIIKKQVPYFVGMIDEDDNLVATALILLKKIPLGYSYGYSPRGFIIDYNNKDLIKEFTNNLKVFMKKKKIIYIKFDPDIKYQDIDEYALPIKNGNNNYELYNYMLSLGYKHKGFNKLYEGNQPRYTFRIDLNKPWLDIENKMSKSFLQSVKRSYQYNLTIDNNPDITSFYNLMKITSQKDGFNPHNELYYQTLHDMFKDYVKFFNVNVNIKEQFKRMCKELQQLKNNINNVSKKKITDYQDKIRRLEKEKELFNKYNQKTIVICTIITISTNNHIWSFFQASNDIASATGAVMRCYYEAIKWAYNQKCYDFFDLFGTVGDPHTTYKNLASLHDFKRKFGSNYIEFIGEFDLINNNFLYKILPILLTVYRKLKKYKT